MKKIMGLSKKPKVCLLVTGFSCNNNCIFCSVAHCRDSSHKDRTSKDIENELFEKRKEGFKKIEFIGGEPTIRSDIVGLVKYVRKLGYKKIAITSNGRMFSYKEFAQNIVNAGLNRVYVSLYGHTPSLHNGITRTPGSFEQTLAGIKNLKNLLKSRDLFVNTVVCKQNYKELDKIIEFLIQLGIKNWNLLSLIPEGRAKKFYKNFSVDMTELPYYLEKLSLYSRKFHRIFLFDFPFCIMPEKIIRSKKFKLPRLKDLSYIIQTGYNPENPILGEAKKQFKIRPSICQNCKFKDDCTGYQKIAV